MATAVMREPAVFSLRTDLLNILKEKAARVKWTLNEYVESILLDDVYNEPNAVTKAAIEEAKNRKDYPKNELYHSADEMFKALNAEIDAE